MPTDYSKKKVVELEELLKARSLPHTGKKADLIARLQEADLKRNSSTANAAPVASAPKSSIATKPVPAPAPAPAPTPAAAEDMIDWDDETNTHAAPPATQPAPSKSTSAAPKTEAKKKSVEVPAPSPTTATTTSTTGSAKPAGAGAALNPVAVPNQVAAIDPSKTNDLTVTSPVPKTTPASPSKPKATATAETSETAPTPTATETYTSNLPSTDPKAELAKRAARAARFGITDAGAKESDATAADAERQKALEREKKFGAVEEESVTAALDRALPDRGTKRGRGAEDGGGRSESKRGRRERSGQPGKGGPREESKTGGSRRRGNNGKGREQGRSTERTTNSKANGKTNDNKTNAKPDNANTNNNTSTNPAPKSDKRDKDLAAAEARKKRFAAPAATIS